MRFSSFPLFLMVALSPRFSFCKVSSSALLSFFPWLTASLFQGNRAVRKGHHCIGVEVSQVPEASPTESFEDHGNNLHLDSGIMRELVQRPVCQNDAFTVACVAKQTSSCFCSSGSSFHSMYFSVLDTMRCINQSGGHTFVHPCCQVSVR